MSQPLVLPSAVRLIQEIRLLHVLLESRYRFRLSPEQAQRMERVREAFGLNYEIAPPDAAQNDGFPPGVRLRDWQVESEGAVPLTRIGSIQRPLLFAHGLWDWARPMAWAPPEARPVRWLFIGLLTQRRRKILGDWIARNPTLGAVLPPQNSVEDLTWKLRARARNALRLPLQIRESRIERGDVVFWSSERGRHFPTKAWDENYYRALGNAQFVLCPNGDMVWTYRFFEALLCGALPVVQQSCAAYDGYTYASMDDNVAEIEWTPAIARANFELCRERLSVPLDQLNAELARIVEAA